MKKAQLSGIIYVIIVIIVSGFVLAWMSDLVNTTRDDALDVAPDDAIFGRLLLVGLKPILWFFFIILSLIILVSTILGGAFT
jgi:uncharacterized membrane-anchored protein